MGCEPSGMGPVGPDYGSAGSNSEGDSSERSASERQRAKREREDALSISLSKMSVLTCGPTTSLPPAIVDQLKREGASYKHFSNFTSMTESLFETGASVVLVQFDEPGALTLAKVMKGGGVPTAVILLKSTPTTSDLREAMRGGAIDVLDGSSDEEALHAIRVAAQVAWERGAHLQAPQQLKERHPPEQPSAAAKALTLLENACHETLDIESMLRATLETVFQNSGPTNAAIFVNSQCGDWEVGAYCNIDFPSDTVCTYLEFLAGSLPVRVIEHGGVIHKHDRKSVMEVLDGATGVDWLNGNSLLACQCLAGKNDAPRAIIALFRSDALPFGAEVRENLKVVASILGASIERLLNVHNRMQL